MFLKRNERGNQMILTVLDPTTLSQNYRFAEEILHNRDRAWMNEYILN